MYIVNPQFVAIINAAQAALTVSQQLPQTDLVMEIEAILKTQISIAFHMVEGKSFGIRKINKFLEYTDNLIDSFANEEKI